MAHNILMKIGLLLLVLTLTATRGIHLSKKITDLLQDVLDESKQSDDDKPNDDLLEIAEKVKEVKKKKEVHPHHKEGSKLSEKISDLLQGVIDESRGNTSLTDDVEEILNEKLAPEKETKRDHPNQSSCDAFDKAVDNIAEIVKEGIMDKLKFDFNHKFDESEEEIYKKIRKDAAASPWLRRRMRRWKGKK